MSTTARVLNSITETDSALGPILNFAMQLVTISVVEKMFPATPPSHISANLPVVLTALNDASLADKPMVLMALSTIRAETETFQPCCEGKSKFNTSATGSPFDLYDHRRDLGNSGPPDGVNFRGRGFVQLTGRANYTTFASRLGLDLVNNPDLANEPPIAARILAAFLKDKEQRIRQALDANDLKLARRLVNGGSNGLDRFQQAFQIGAALIPR